NSREQGAYLGKHVLEVEVIELSDRSLRLAEIEDADFPVGAQNAEYLSQPSVVICEVSESEGGRHEVKGGVLKRHVQSVGFHPAQRSSLPFDLRTTQHLARKICAGNRGSASAGAPIQSKGHVAGPAAEIEHLCIVLAEDVAESTSGTPPPETIDVHRQHVIEQIVAGRDGVEHLPHGGGGGLLIAGSLWTSADCFGLILHRRHAWERYLSSST